MDRGARRAGFDGDLCPLSDGGEGFAEVLAAVPGPTGAVAGSWHQTTVTGPLGDPVTARWWLADGVAVVESAAASGLPLAGGADGNDPLRATTRGTGELLMAAASAGARRVLVGVGGSATTDGGRGAIEAIEEAGGLGPVEVVVACDVETRFVEAAARLRTPEGRHPRPGHRARGPVGGAGRSTSGPATAWTSLTSPAPAPPVGWPEGWPPSGRVLVPGFGVVADAVGLAAPGGPGRRRGHRGGSPRCHVVVGEGGGIGSRRGELGGPSGPGGGGWCGPRWARRHHRSRGGGTEPLGPVRRGPGPGASRRLRGNGGGRCPPRAGGTGLASDRNVSDHLLTGW